MTSRPSSFTVPADRRVVAEDAARVRRPVVAREDEVVREREREDEPEAVAVGWHVRHARLVHVPGGASGHVLRPQEDLAGGRPAEPDDRLDELVLTVASDPGDAEDLAGADLEAHASDDLGAPIVLHPQVLDLQRRPGRV